MQIYVYYNPHMGTQSHTCTRSSVNAALLSQFLLIRVFCVDSFRLETERVQELREQFPTTRLCTTMAATFMPR